MCRTGKKHQADEVRKVNVTYENGWEHMNIHVDIPVPYEENYQVKMLGSNKIPGLLEVKGSGRDGHGRYTFRIRSGNTMMKEFGGKDLKKEDILRFTEDLVETVDALKEYLLDPDRLLLEPELVFVENGKYRFCYLPVDAGEKEGSLCRAFHCMTEYFVRNLDYQDTEGVFLACKMHKETMKESYELRKIMDSCAEERACSEEKKKMKSEDDRDCFSGTAVFSVSSGEDEKEKKQNSTITGEGIIGGQPVRYSPFRKAVNRIRTGRWGQWEDLITEMDGQNIKGHI